MALTIRKYCVYVLSGQGKLYIGLTGNINQRLAAHRAGECVSSRKAVGEHFVVLHVWWELSYVQASKLERWLHRLPHWTVLEVIDEHPSFDGCLADTVCELTTTPYEIKRMDTDCVAAGIQHWR